MKAFIRHGVETAGIERSILVIPKGKGCLIFSIYFEGALSWRNDSPFYKPKDNYEEVALPDNFEKALTTFNGKEVKKNLESLLCDFVRNHKKIAKQQVISPATAAIEKPIKQIQEQIVQNDL
ncbi:MAG: hypothetical protein WC349_03220 [Patescibacteria group bacterium]|jgi:hypothetical protein